MKRLLILVLISIIYVSCKVQYQPRTFENIFIKEIKMDSISIRSIQVIDANNIVYTGSNGKIGFLSLNKEQIKIDKIITPHIYSGSIIPDFRSLAFNGESYFALSVGNPALLYKVFNDKAKLVYKEINQKVFYDSMHFWNDNEGIVVGDFTEKCINILITRDGGDSWIKQDCSKFLNIEEGEGFFAASDTNISVKGDNIWLATGGINSRVYYSNNKGKDWKVIETPIIQGESTTGIFSIDFYDQKNGFAIGGDYTKPLINSNNKIRTTDGGLTWTVVAENQNPGYRSCVQYVPNSKGLGLVSLGFNGVDYSSDAGDSWTNLSSEGYYSFRFYNDSIAYAAGNGKISKFLFK